MSRFSVGRCGENPAAFRLLDDDGALQVASCGRDRQLQHFAVPSAETRQLVHDMGVRQCLAGILASGDRNLHGARSIADEPHVGSGRSGPSQRR